MTLRKRAGYVKYYRQSWYSQFRTWAARLNQPVAFRLCRVDARYEWDVWFVVSVNILRRQLDPSLRAGMAVEISDRPSQKNAPRLTLRRIDSERSVIIIERQQLFMRCCESFRGITHWFSTI